MASMLYQHLPAVIGVVGAGQMGAGIAQIVASKGLQVVLSDRNLELVDRGITGIKKSLEKFVAKGSITAEDATNTLQRIQMSDSLQAMANVDLVVEAVSENEQLKQSIFHKLDEITPMHTILASNTSSISITKLGSATCRPHKVIGMHFMNPVPIMQLVELITGMHTSEQTYDATKRFAEHLGKQICVSADRPGFIVNRVLMPSINEAFFCMMEGIASAEDIDKGMKLGTNWPVGPLKLADMIGLDTCLSIMQVLHTGLGDPKYRPCPLLAQYVDAGWLGKKVGRGVYHYEHSVQDKKDKKHL